MEKLENPQGEVLFLRKTPSFYREKPTFEAINEVVNDAKFATDNTKKQKSFLIVDKNMLNLELCHKKMSERQNKLEFYNKIHTIKKGIAGNIKMDIKGNNDARIRCMDNICK